MQICTSPQTDNHASTPSLIFYRLDACPATQLSVSNVTKCDFNVSKSILVVVKDILRDLHLPKENTLFLLTPTLTQAQSATADE